MRWLPVPISLPLPLVARVSRTEAPAEIRAPELRKENTGADSSGGMPGSGLSF